MELELSSVKIMTRNHCESGIMWKEVRDEKILSRSFFILSP